MRYSNSFGKKSSKILLGTAYFGDTISPEESFKIMDTFVENGGSHIDTARLYADGEAEKVIGAWLKSRRHEGIFLSTKGAFPDKATPTVMRLHENEIRYDLELSLKALDIDCIEFYWLHRDDETIPAGEIIETMNKLVKEGKIRHFGASNWKHNRVAEGIAYAKEHGLQPFESSQIRFSPAIVSPYGNADRSLVDMTAEAFKYYKAAGIPVAAYASQAKGFFSKMAETGVDALNQKSRERYLCKENLSRLEFVKKYAKKYETSVASIVCAALSSIPCVDVFPIIGGSRPEQIKDSMSGADIVLQRDELEKLFKFSML